MGLAESDWVEAKGTERVKGRVMVKGKAKVKVMERVMVKAKVMVMELVKELEKVLMIIPMQSRHPAVGSPFPATWFYRCSKESELPAPR